MKKVWMILALLGAGFALAQTNNQSHNWKINFPKFAYVWVNVGDLTFDLSSIDDPTNLGYLAALTDVYEPTQNGLLACLNGQENSDFAEPSGDYEGTTEEPDAVSCYFAPDIDTDSGSDYDATYYDQETSEYDNVADADFYIISTSASWTLTAQADAEAPTGVSLLAYPYAWDEDETTLEGKDGSNVGLDAAVTITSDAAATLSAGANDKGYYVNGKYWAYLQPVNYALKINLGEVSLPIDEEEIEITYTVSVQ